MEKILISTDTNGIATFKKSVQSTADEANSLIELYHAFQPWQRVTSQDQFITLVTNPADYFDSTLLNNVEFKAKGVTPDPARLAELIGIHRAEFLNLCSGLNIPDDGHCPPCGKVRIKRGVRAISLYTFEQYRDYLLFDAGSGFTVDQAKVDTDLDKFNFYAETEEEIAVYNLHHDLARLLNEFTALSPISTTEREAIKKALKFHLSQGHQGDFMVNVESMKNAIIKFKYYKNETDRN
jgi:hypothetical protein